jgi:hypothetical protein
MSTDLIVLLIIAFTVGLPFAVVLLVAGIRGLNQPSPLPPAQNCEFTVALKVGELQVAISYHSETGNPFMPRAKRIIGLWAIEREDRSKSKALHLAVESELRAHLSEFQPSVINVDVIGIEPEQKELKKLTAAEVAIARLRAKKEVAKILLAEDNSDVRDTTIKGRPLELMVQEDIKTTINYLFHDPNQA